MLANIENSLLYDFGAYVVAISKKNEPEKSVNPFEKFTDKQLVEELRKRGHNVIIDGEHKLAIPVKKDSRFEVLELE